MDKVFSKNVYSPMHGEPNTVIEPGNPQVVDCYAKLCPFFVVSPHVEDDICLQDDCGCWNQSRRCCGFIATMK